MVKNIQETLMGQSSYSRGSEFCTVPYRSVFYFPYRDQFLEKRLRTVPRSIQNFKSDQNREKRFCISVCFIKNANRTVSKNKSVLLFLMSENRTVLLFGTVFRFCFKSASRIAQKMVNFSLFNKKTVKYPFSD